MVTKMKIPAKIVVCNGEAHSEPHIDNCGVCMPWWLNIRVCPTDNRKLTSTGYCRDCRKHFDVEVADDGQR